MSETPTPEDVLANLVELFEDHGAVLTPKDISKVLGYTEQTVINWLDAKTLRGFRLGRTWRIVKKDFFEDMVPRSSLNLAPESTITPEN